MTDKDGNFEIKDVPPGTYTLMTWSEDGKPTTQSVDVAAGAVDECRSHGEEVGRIGIREDRAIGASHKTRGPGLAGIEFPCMQACPVHTQAGRYVTLDRPRALRRGVSLRPRSRILSLRSAAGSAAIPASPLAAAENSIRPSPSARSSAF